MDPPRIILHLDMDSFFASVEIREHPEFRGKPLVVGADPKGGSGRGVVSTASYEARKFGIRSGMPISRAYALCPDGVYVRPHFPLYIAASRGVMEVLSAYSDHLHQVSIDEAFLDITHAGGYREAEETARRIKAEILAKVGLTCSIGIGPSRIVAKIASDLEKPDGLTVVTPEQVTNFLVPLPAGRIPGIGKKTRAELEGMGIRTIGELAQADVQLLQSRFGKWGIHMHELAHGRDIHEARGDGASRSMSRETTFEQDTGDPATLLAALGEMAADLRETLARENLFFRTLTLKIRYTGFVTKTLSRTLPHATNGLREIRDLAGELLAVAPRKGTVRLLGIRLSNLQEKGPSQRSIGEYLPGGGPEPADGGE
ncbi:MAG TPA: DNA polymerase IV [Methanomicrobiales archaeon]|jgi:DNA polymerase IV (DinB-like DNA polymerase)|nr:DNA polymerase IV [Methanomicrobiales archaeon]